MKPETRYTIAFIVAKLANPGNYSTGILDEQSNETKYFSGKVEPTQIDIEETGPGRISASSQNENNFSSIYIANTGESCQLKVSGTSFDGRAGNEYFQGRVSGSRISFNSGENYQLR